MFSSWLEANWRNAAADLKLSSPAVDKLLSTYQHPEQADNLLRIQRELDDVKDVLRGSMQQLMERGEKIETIIEKSEDLDMSSKQFLWNAQKTNSCCSYG